MKEITLGNRDELYNQHKEYVLKSKHLIDCRVLVNEEWRTPISEIDIKDPSKNMIASFIACLRKTEDEILSIEPVCYDKEEILKIVEEILIGEEMKKIKKRLTEEEIKEVEDRSKDTEISDLLD